MNENTIKKLNALNKDFYDKTTVDFDDSRQYYWSGWENIIGSIINFSQLKLLDVGCGNGRFLKFLLEKFPNKDIHYLGIDNSAELLKFALKRNNYQQAKFNKIDLVDELLKSSNPKIKFLESKKFNLIVAFGYFHHIPSYDLRLKTLKYLLSKLDSEGIIIISLWKFMEFDRFVKKQIEVDLVGINNSDLEENDFILNWKRGSDWKDNNKALRYCHYINEKEQRRLIKEGNAKLLKNFREDGKESRVNQYLILKNK